MASLSEELWRRRRRRGGGSSQHRAACSQSSTDPLHKSGHMSPSDWTCHPPPEQRKGGVLDLGRSGRSSRLVELAVAHTHHHQLLPGLPAAGN